MRHTIPWGRWSVLLALAGCAPMPPATLATSAMEPGGAPAEMRTNLAEWDGRPTMGGVWVADGDVTTPGRAMLRNPDTGASATGVLLRRDRTRVGDAAQLSAEAAAALGIPASTPHPITITSLPPGTETPAAHETVAKAPPPQAIVAHESFPAAARIVPVATPVSGNAVLSIATFGREETARAAAETLRARGVPVNVTAGGGARNPLWQVSAGPMAANDVAAVAANVKAAGFADAYLVAQ